MATSLLALLDDITTLLDDVSVLTKVAAKKTAGVLGDDLALNAQQVSGVRAERELPVVWAVAKGSLVNKAILVPAALAISAVAPWAVTPLLMVGGAFLCFEGMEKVAHRLMHSRAEDEAHHREIVEANANPQVDVVAVEKAKIKGAIRTDFILSAEIIVISLGTVAGADFLTRLTVLVGIALVMTAGVYGLVGAIVKLDDFGAYLTRRGSAGAQAVGSGILRAAPWLMKGLSVAGTIAMFLVGGSILAHGIEPLHHWIESTAEAAGAWGKVLSMLLDAAVGMTAGALLVAGYALAQRLRGKRSAHA
jgi:predicted DNA repair protein MutK